MHDESGGGQYWLINLVQRGFAEKSKDKDGKDNGILIGPKGLLMGAVLNDIYKLKRIDKQMLWHKRLWGKYASGYGAEHFLAKRYKYWFYWLFTKLGWLVFIAAVVLVFWSLVDKFVALYASIYPRH